MNPFKTIKIEPWIIQEQVVVVGTVLIDIGPERSNI